MTALRFLLLASILPASIGFAQDAKSPPQDLAAPQLQIQRDYERFEKALFDVAEQARLKDRERAELLYRARERSQEMQVLAEMQSIAELLRQQDAAGNPSSPQYGPAVDRQRELLSRMQTVLTLLQSLDERERLAAEIERYQELLKETNRLIARQKDVRADTQRGKAAEAARGDQQRVEKEAGDLERKIDEQERKRQAERDQRNQDSGKETDGESSEGESSEGESSENSQGSESEPSEGDSSQQSESSQSQSSPQSSQSQSQSGQNQDSQQTPGREQLEQARQKMQQAIERLEEQNRDEATRSQDEAVQKLEEMRAELEEILRQLRKDEKETYLTALEARFQNMLKRQMQINSETVRLDGIPADKRPQENFASKTDNIRKEQEDNALEAAKALNLLKEEGSSVAFPEAVAQMVENMRVVQSRLAAQDTGGTTQLVEQLIVETLEDMINAFREELEKEQNEQEQPSGQQGGGQPQEQALINQIAELKLIRSMQLHVNRLTQQIGTEIEAGEAPDPDQARLIRDLAERQKRIQSATDDLSVGRNK